MFLLDPSFSVDALFESVYHEEPSKTMIGISVYFIDRLHYGHIDTAGWNIGEQQTVLTMKLPVETTDWIQHAMLKPKCRVSIAVEGQNSETLYPSSAETHEYEYETDSPYD